ncbi:sigma-70 family RNA polymerase sigma factor [Nocardiopsis sp. NPDC007018]|uniref:sigma-70 family RNA polymerase sigma factor n=1 Tax=Nocardiopsis sp. NPDC007018 TaxID=3155721 RepID=UPI0033BFC50A
MQHVTTQRDLPDTRPEHTLDTMIRTASQLAVEFTGRPGMSHADIDDATAHAVKEAHRATVNGTEIRSLRAWMRTVAERFHARQVGDREHESLVEEVDRASILAHDPRQLPEEQLDLAEGTRLVLELLAALPPLQRKAMTLHALGGLRVVDVAQELGIPASTARKRIVRAREALLAMGHERLSEALGLTEVTSNPGARQGNSLKEGEA